MKQRQEKLNEYFSKLIQFANRKKEENKKCTNDDYDVIDTTFNQIITIIIIIRSDTSYSRLHILYFCFICHMSLPLFFIFFFFFSFLAFVAKT